MNETLVVNETLLELLGRAHPLVLHLPIGLFAGLVAVELVSALGGRTRRADRAAGVLLWLTVLATLAAAATGLLLAREGAHAPGDVVVHRNLGLALTGLVCLAGLFHAVGGRGWYLRTLAVALLVMIPAGHFGATLTHGERFLYAPLLAGTDQAPTPAVVLPVAGPQHGGDADGARPTYATHVAPIFAGRCVSCHGPDARKGGLRLDSPGGIARGGKTGPVLAVGDAAASALLVRMTSPVDADGHMPPRSKPQPTARELALIEAWIAAGAPWAGAFAAPDMRVAPIARTEPGGAVSAGAAPLPHAEHADEIDLRRLRDAFVHVAPVDPALPNLVVDLAPMAARVDDARFAELIGPVAGSVGELHAARAPIGDGAMSALAGADALTVLDISWTGVGRSGLESVAGLPNLRTLRSVGARLDDSAVETLAQMPALRTVYVWRAGISASGLERLAAERPDLRIVADAERVEAVETEGELSFSGDRPVPGGDAADSERVSLAPVNDRCPVSGAPVDPAVAVVHGGRVVAFCCTDCLKTFVDDPAAYAAALAGG